MLTKWGINRLVDRCVRRALIKIYKSVNGLDEVNWERDVVKKKPTYRLLTRKNGVYIRRDK